MARPPKADKADKTEEKVKTSNDILSQFLEDNSEDHYNDVQCEPVRISSGSLIMDSLVKITSGTVVRLVGKGAELGKTSEAFVLASNYMSTMPRSKTLYIKAEGRLSEDLKARTGMKFTIDSKTWGYGEVFVFSCNVFETVASLITDLLVKMHEDKEHLCIIIDSLDGLILKNDLAKKIEEGQKVAGVPLLTKLLFKHLSLPIEAYNALLLITGQYSAEIKLDPYAPAGAPRMGESSGGSAMAHQASVVLSYAPRYNGDYILEDPDEKPDPIKNKQLGVYASVEVKKSLNDVTNCGKIRIPIRKGRIGCAVWIEKEIADILLMTGLAIKKGAWINISTALVEEMKAIGIELSVSHNGINKLNAYLEESPLVVDYLKKKFQATLLA